MTLLLAFALVGAQAEPAEPIHVPEPEALREMHQVAACIVREYPAEVRAVLAMDFRTRAYRRRLIALPRQANRCFGRFLGMSGLPFAGSLAEQLYLRTHAGVDPATLVSPPLPEARNRTEALTYCVVRDAPAQSRAVLDTAVASAEEAAALGALRPAIAACLQGSEQAQLNRTGLRSLIALALYRLGRRQPA